MLEITNLESGNNLCGLHIDGELYLVPCWFVL